MYRTIQAAGETATNDAPAGESEGAPTIGVRLSTLARGSDRHEWFYAAACSLLGKDPGLQLNLLTGYPVSSCSAYVHNEWAKRRRPPEHFIRAVCHVEQGFHSAFMGGCEARWWLDFQHAAEIGRKVLDITR
jgi:hypothetical protein